MYKIGDYVKVIKGLHNGSEGTVAKISKNDMGTITYEIHVEKLFKRIGNISKREGEIEMAKRGRPVKNANKVEQLKEVTKQVVEMTEAEPTAAVEEVVEVVDKTVEEVTSEEENNNFAPTYAKGGVIGGSSKVELEVGEVVVPIDEIKGTVDKAVEVVDEVVDELFDEVAIEPESEPKAYDQLREVYDELCKKLTFVELSSFYDIVAKDMKTSKYVLEQMYQMSIEQLAKIREELA